MENDLKNFKFVETFFSRFIFKDVPDLPLTFSSFFFIPI